jgi:hypothetical protein
LPPKNGFVAYIKRDARQLIGYRMARDGHPDVSSRFDQVSDPAGIPGINGFRAISKLAALLAEPLWPQLQHFPPNNSEESSVPSKPTASRSERQ